MSKVNQYSPFWSLFRLSIEVEKKVISDFDIGILECCLSVGDFESFERLIGWLCEELNEE